MLPGAEAADLSPAKGVSTPRHAPLSASPVGPETIPHTHWGRPPFRAAHRAGKDFTRPSP